jgi:very-short-patch-repair endonuclease
MNMPLSSKTYKALIKYYIDCLEKEDMFSIIFNINDNKKKFIMNPLSQETLFHENDEDFSVPHSMLPESCTQKREEHQKQKSIFYGYPLVLNSDGTISPLFSAELTITSQNENIVSFRKTNLDLNHAILSTFGLEIEEIQRLRLELKEYSFVEQIDNIMVLLHLPVGHITSTLDTQPLKPSRTPQILNKTILYTGERTGITKNLIQELHRLEQLPSDEIRSTSLGCFLKEKTLEDPKKVSSKQILEVFPLNDSQRHAVEHALSQPFTVITGPPGTGKSQVVLDIIANAVFQDKTVLFSSKNNKAVDVVREKLQPILSKPLIVRMGAEIYRKEAKAILCKLFPQKEIHSIDDRIDKQLSALDRISEDISRTNNHIQQMREINDSIDKSEDKIHECMQKIPHDVLLRCKADGCKEVDLVSFDRDLRGFGDTQRFYRRYIRRVFSKNHKKKLQKVFQEYHDILDSNWRSYLEQTDTSSSDDMYHALYNVFLAVKIAHTKEYIGQLEKNLIGFEPINQMYDRLENLRDEQKKISRTIFDKYWLNKVNAKSSTEQEAVIRTLEVSEQLNSYVDNPTIFRKLSLEWKRKMQRIMEFLPVWVITNLSARSSVPLKNNLFDILIIDEASQCDIASALPLFYRAKNVVIIGDPKQLRHISLLSQDQDGKIAMENNIDDVFNDYSYTKNSLYDLADKIGALNNIRPILLDEHYRCARDIISFSNECFYGKLLHVLTDERRLRPSDKHITHGIVWYDVCGTTIRSGSSYNDEEAEYVVDILKKLILANEPTVSYGVVTFFRAQMELIRQKINDIDNLRDKDITVGTAHRFQGDEKDVIIFSPVVSSEVKECTLQWIHSTTQLLNVAITRAKTAVLVVGDRNACLKAKGILGELVSYAQCPKENEEVDTDGKQLFAALLRENKIRIIPGYWVRCEKKVRYQIDFALFVHRSKYALEVIDDSQQEYDKNDAVRYAALRSEGWKIRRFHIQDIIDNPDGVIKRIQHVC